MIRPEWSHRIEAEDIGATPVRKVISASPQERKDLARRMRVESIESLTATLVLQRNPKNMYMHLTGDLEAAVVQECVVTMEPITDHISGPVEGWFADPETVVSLVKARHERQGRRNDAELPILEEQDDPEPITEGQIDLGELVAQHLSLSINPYPHKEGVEFERITAPGMRKAIPEGRQNPFAALKNWKKRADKADK